MATNTEKIAGLPGQVGPVVRDRHGNALFVGDSVMLHDCMDQHPPILGVLVYDKACWAYSIHSDDGKRYLLMDNLRTCIDPGDGGFAWKEIESSNKEICRHESEGRDEAPTPAEGGGE